MVSVSACTQCGEVISDGSRFCGECGSPAAEKAAPSISVRRPSVGIAGVDKTCFACGRSWGQGRACQFCRQVEGLPVGITLCSPAKRLGANLLDGLLMGLTLGLGWLVWCLIVMRNGQSPAKQILGMRASNLQTGEPASWGRMFLREFIAKPVIGTLSIVTLGIANFWLIWDKDNQELWDKVAGTIVVNG